MSTRTPSSKTKGVVAVDPFRRITADRIKVLSVLVILPATLRDEQVADRLATQMGREIAAKLVEFNKVESTPDGADRIRYGATIEVIVPETPVSNRR